LTRPGVPLSLLSCTGSLQPPERPSGASLLPARAARMAHTKKKGPAKQTVGANSLHRPEGFRQPLPRLYAVEHHQQSRSMSGYPVHRSLPPTRRSSFDGENVPDGTPLKSESWLHLYLASHRCRRGSTTSSRATGQAMLTALRRSRFESRYSSARATRTTISPLSEVRGPEAATKPLLWDPSSRSSSTRCPGSGTSGSFFLP
jgi:hypothetical protein